MKDSINNEWKVGVNKDGKKLLKTQIYRVSEQISKGLSTLDSDQSQSKKNSELQHIKNTENAKIYDLLQDRSEYLATRAIVWDILIYTKKIWWEEKYIIQFKCKYGLWIVIDNLNSFLDFCAIHWFVPMVDKIYIESQDVTKIKELYTFFAFAITNPSNPLIANSLANEIRKLEETAQWPVKEVLLYLQQIILYTTSTYQYLLWDRLQKVHNLWTLSENIFAEIAIRVENQIREKVWIESSYLKLAWFKDDINNKTDMDFIIKRTPSQAYQMIPLQFTTWSVYWVKTKERDIEKFLIKSINNDSKIDSFIIFSVNWEFSKHITHEDKNDKTALNMEYKDWIEDRSEREKSVWNKFPLFIDSINWKIIQPAEIMYIALHMLFKRYCFKYSEKDSYLQSFKNGKIDRTNHSEINGVILDEIYIDNENIEKIDNPRPWYPWILKHEFRISYRWEIVWMIVVYKAGCLA
mgnify:CR=1 FL=1